MKHQLGLSAGLVYHASESLHLDLDYFRADFRWQLGGQKQILNFVSDGTTFEW